MPFRYRYIHLSPHWYASASGKRVNDGKKVRRKHRKSHGKISFLDLSKAISTRWKELEVVDSMTKVYVQKVAARLLDSYKKESKLFKMNNSTAISDAAFENALSMVSQLAEQALPVSSRRASILSTATSSSNRSFDINEVKEVSSCAFSNPSSFELDKSSSWHEKYEKLTSKKPTTSRRFSIPSSPARMERMTFGLPSQAHTSPYYYRQNKRHSDPPITNSGDINQVGNDSSIRSDQYRRPKYDYHTSMEELNNDIQEFMTRGGFMEGERQQQQNSPNEITPTDIALRRASIEMSAGDVLDLMEALSD